MHRNNNSERENFSTRESSEGSYARSSDLHNHLLDSSYGKPGDEIPKNDSISNSSSGQDRAGSNSNQQYLDIPSLWQNNRSNSGDSDLNNRNGQSTNNQQTNSREFSAGLEQSARQTASQLGTTGNCAKGVRMALNQMGFNIAPGRDATELGRHLAESGKFDKVPLSEMNGNPPPGSIVVRNWNEDVIRQNGGKNHGDIAVMGQNGMQYNDHARQFQPDGGRYRDSYVLTPKGESSGSQEQDSNYGGRESSSQRNESASNNGSERNELNAEQEQSSRASSSGGSNGQRIWSFLRNDLNLTRAQAAGVMGNLQQESHLNPNQRQYGGGPGFGLAQWEGPRKSALEQFASRQGSSPGSLDTQLKFMKHELNTTERSAFSALRNATTPEQAALAFNNKYERAGRPNMSARNKFAREALERYESS